MTSNMISSMFSHDAEEIKNAIFAASTKESLRNVHFRLTEFMDKYEVMEEDEEEQGVEYWSTLQYLMGLLEQKEEKIYK